MMPLRATARLQLHAGFDLDAAAAQVPYYAGLGVSHLYLSPIGTAVPGSTHGYDNTDPGTVNPELGGEAGLRHLARQARAHGLGLLLDIVPNHMAAHPSNRWWWDVLAHGRGSRHAGWFDIDWEAPGREGRLWLPVLDRPCAQALAEGVLTVAVQAGQAVLDHHGQRFPLAGVALPARPADARAWCQALNDDAVAGGTRLAACLHRQAYRLAWWRSGNERVNYRRFFDITSLVALRVELPAVFEAVHALPLRLVEQGWVDGLRVDHVDGLADPAGYLRRLRQRLDAAGRRRGLAAGSIALYVEKILAPEEALPASWRCDGSTGYDFMDQVAGLLHAAAGWRPLHAAWRRHSGRSGDFDAEQRQARREILAGPLLAELQRGLAALPALAAAEPGLADLTPSQWAQALAALLRHFPVYRSYAGRHGLDPAGRAQLQACAQAASAELAAPARLALQAIQAWLQDDAGAPAAQARLRRRLRLRFEQLCAPLNAKAVEDTTFYRHGLLLSRNEVGSHPDQAHFACPPPHFHRACLARAASRPHALLATATHDHKRGEDVRARLAVLSSAPQWWLRQVRGMEMHAAGHGAPSGGDRWMLWQTLVAAWPLALRVDDRDGLLAYAGRVGQWQLKALREAKLASSWTEPDLAYEQAAADLVEHALLDRAGLPLRRGLAQAAAALGPAGARNGLVQLALRLTVPGVPDLYQGTEGWDLSLVDPDNRRPVDYPQRQAWLADPRPWPVLLRHWRDGAAKARLLARLLQLRRQQPGLFAHGDYRPLALPPGPRQRLAFERRWQGQCLRVMVAWSGGLEGPPLHAVHWPAEALGLDDRPWRDVLDGQVWTPGQRTWAGFGAGPVAAWISS